MELAGLEPATSSGAISSAAVADNLRRNWPDVDCAADLLEVRPLTAG